MYQILEGLRMEACTRQHRPPRRQGRPGRVFHGRGRDEGSAGRAEAAAAWRWYLEEDSKGNVVGIQFNGEKLGDDNILFEALGPFVQKGSFIQMQGEDGTMWRWTFNGTDMREVTATVSWSYD
jgi:hypothetical protein